MTAEYSGRGDTKDGGQPLRQSIQASEDPAAIPRFALYGSDDIRPTWSFHIDAMVGRCEDAGCIIEPHIHARYIQLLLITAGEGTMTLERNLLPIKAGDAVIVRENTVHSFAFNAQTEGWAMTFDQRYLSGLRKCVPEVRAIMRSTGIFNVGNELLGELSAGIAYLRRELQSSRSGRSINADLHLRGLLLRLHRRWPSRANTAEVVER